MNNDLLVDGKKYISAIRASKKIDYSSDYIGQLCRAGKIQGKLIGKTWYVDFESLLDHRRSKKPRGRRKATEVNSESLNYNEKRTESTPPTVPNISKLGDFSNPQILQIKNTPIVYEKDERSYLPELKKPSLPTKPLVRSAVLKDAVTAFTALLIILSSGVNILDQISPLHADKTLNALADISEKEEEILIAIKESSLDPIEKYIDDQLAAILFFENISRGFEDLKRIAYENLFFRPGAVENPAPAQLAGTESDGTEWTRLEVASRSSSPVFNLESLKRELREDILNYVRINIPNSSVVSYISPSINFEPVKTVPVIQNIYQTITSQSTSDIDLISKKIGDILDGGTFINSILAGATVSGPTGHFNNFTFTNATGTAATTTNFFSNSGTFTNLFGTIADLTDLVFTRATGTSATTTNFFSTTASSSNLFATNFNLGDGLIGRSTTTNATTTSLFSTTASSTNLFSSLLNVGSNGLVVDSSGKVGIGTSTPASDLDIRQRTNGDVILSATRATDSAPTGDFIQYYNAARDTLLFRVDNSGNLLAGGIINSGSQTITSTSQPQLRVQYDASNEVTTSVTSAGVTTFGYSGSTPRGIFQPSTNRTDSFQFQNSTGTSILNVDTTNGRIGIGTDAPDYKLHVVGDVFISGNSTTTNATSTNFFSNTASSTNLFATSANLGNLTAGLINGQTISSAANFTGTLTATGGLTTLSNLLLTGSSTLQNFTFVNATGTSATTTNLFSTSAFFNGLGVGTYDVDSTALVELDSTTKGFLAPRMTTVQRDNISSPATGLLVYNTTTNKYNVYNGTSWKSVGSTEVGGDVENGTAGSVLFVGAGSLLSQDNSNFFWDNINKNLGIGTTSPYAKLSIVGGTSGTVIAADALSGFIGNLLDLKVASSTKLSVSQTGQLSINGDASGSGAATLASFTQLGTEKGRIRLTSYGDNLNYEGYGFNSYASKFALTSDTFTMNNAFHQMWSSSAVEYGTPDLGIVRNSAGVLRISDGSSGQGDLLFKNSTSTSATSTSFFSTTASSTNLFATNFNLGDGLIGRSTTTNATTTSLFSTTASSTSLFSTNFNLGTGSIGSLSDTLLITAGGIDSTLSTSRILQSNNGFRLLRSDGAATIELHQYKPTLINESLGILEFYGLGSGFIDADASARVYAVAEETFDILGQGKVRLVFDTRGTGLDNAVERMTLTGLGNLGVGTSTPGARVHSLSTTEQLRLGYDQSNYASFTVGSTGNLTLAPTGGTTNLTGNLIISGNSTTTNATTTNFFSTTASSTNLFATSATLGNVTTGALTTGLINGQTISSAANFTGTLNVASKISLNSSIYLQPSAINGNTLAVIAGDFNTYRGLIAASYRFGADDSSSFDASFTRDSAGVIRLTGTGGSGTAKLITDTVYGGTSAGSTLTLAGTNNASPSSAHVLINTLAQGNVGVATTSPFARLSVVGGTSGTVIGADAITGFSGNLLDLKVASSTKFSVDQTGNILSTGYARIGSLTAPANTTAGDLTSTRLSVGNGTLGATSGSIAAFSGSLTDTSSGSKVGINNTLTLNPSATSASEFRTYTTSVQISSGNAQTFSDAIEASYSEIRMLGSGSLSQTNAVRATGLILPSSAVSFGTITDAISVLALPVSEFASTNITGTVTNSRGVRVNNISKTSSSLTITNQIGLNVESLTTGTNNTLVLLGQATAVTGNYGIYNSSSYQNYFAGNFGIGTTTPWGKLSVTNTGTAPSFVVEDSTSPDSTPFLIDASGSVGIGTASPSQLVHAYQATGNTWIQIESDGTDTSVGNIYTNDATTWTAGISGSNSDSFAIANGSGLASPTFVYTTGGLLGLSTTTPDVKLQVHDGEFRLSDSDITHGFTTLSTTNSVFDAEPLSGTVGGALLTGYGESSATAGLVLRGLLGAGDPADATPAIQFRGGKQTGTTGASLGSLETVFQFSDWDGGTDWLTVLGSGNVGIGTVTPEAKLSLFSSNAGSVTTEGNAVLIVEKGSGGNIQFKGSAGLQGLIFGTSSDNDAGRFWYSHTSNEFQWFTNGTQGMTLSSTQNLGVGTTTPWAKLSVTNTGTAPSFVVEDSTSPDSTPFLIDASGSVGIGTASPTATLHVVQPAQDSVTPSPALKVDGGAHTGINTAETIDVDMTGLARSIQFLGGGTLATQRNVAISAPTYTALVSTTITNASTVAITGAPIKSTNVSVTNTHALLISANAVSTATNSFGLTVNAQTGATNNYSAVFLGGNVGVYTAAPTVALEIGSGDLGNGAAGRTIMVGRNSNGTATGAGSVNFVRKDGTAGYVWQDASGNVRIHTAAPSNANDTAGTVVGTQSSTRETKQDILDFNDYNGALEMVLSAPLHTFKYKKEVAGYGADSPLAKARIGYIADEVSDAFMWGNVIDQVSVNGILMASIKELNNKIILQENNATTTNATLEGIQIDLLSVNDSVTEINFLISDIDSRLSDVELRVLELEEMVISGSGLSIETEEDKQALVAVVLQGIEGVFEEGWLKLKQVAVETLRIGSPEKPSGITFYDEDTGEPYCLKIKSGVISTTSGECGAQIVEEVVVIESPIVPEPTDTASSTSTTTDPIEVTETASSTEPVVEGPAPETIPIETASSTEPIQ